MTSPKAHSGSPFVPGALVAGKYRLIKSLGEGAMGVVWSAVNEVTSGEVALKLIWKPEQEYRVRLLREAKACGTVRHKNVIQIHDVGQTDTGDPFLVMELLTGETLAELLARKRRLPPAEAASVGRDIARGLAAAHAKKIVHRDLKPANIFLHNEPGEDGAVVKVLDFGVAKNPLVSDGLRTAVGGAVGSPMYMSPEQAGRERDIDGRADIWSLGVVLFEMLTGERPFRGDLAEVLHQIQVGEIPTVGRRVRRVDPALDAIVAGCLTRRREDRLGPALEVARLLDEHATPGGREQLPSLMEEGISERISGGPASISSAGQISPGVGLAGMQPAPAPMAAPPVSRSSGSGYGAASSGAFPAASASGSYGVTEPLVASPVPRVASSAPLLAGAAAGDDDGATHRLAPRMLAPAPPPSSSMGGQGPTGTVRIDPGALDQALEARGFDRAQVAANLGLGAPPAIAGAETEAGKKTVPLGLMPGMAAPPPGVTSSTAPVLWAEPAAAAPVGAASGSRKKGLAVVGVVLALALVGGAAAAFFLVFQGKAASSAAPDGMTTAVPTPPPPVPAAEPTSSAAGSATPEPPASAAASAEPEPAVSADPSASATPSAAPMASASASAPKPPVPPRPVRPAPAPTPKKEICGTFIKKPGCVPAIQKTNPYDPKAP